MKFMRRSRGKTGGPDPLENQVAIGFFRNSGIDHPREATGTLRSNSFLREVHTALCEIY